MTLNETMRAYVNRTMTEYDKTAIKQDAQRAFKLGESPADACSHPFATERGRYWLACYWATGIGDV